MFILVPLQIIKTWRQLRYPSWWVDKQTLGTNEMRANEDKPWKDSDQSGKARDRMSLTVQQSIKCKSVELYRGLLERSETADVQEETGMLRQGTGDLQGSETTICDSTITSTPTEYTAPGVSLHTADTGWRWWQATVALPTVADAHTLWHRKPALCMLFVALIAVTEYLTTAALERKGLRWLTGWGDRPSRRGKRGYRQHRVGFPSSVKLSGPNQNYSESLEKTTQIKWAVMRTRWSFFCSVFF